MTHHPENIVTIRNVNDSTEIISAVYASNDPFFAMYCGGVTNDLYELFAPFLDQALTMGPILAETMELLDDVEMMYSGSTLTVRRNIMLHYRQTGRLWWFGTHDLGDRVIAVGRTFHISGFVIAALIARRFSHDFEFCFHLSNGKEFVINSSGVIHTSTTIAALPTSIDPHFI